MRSVTPFRAAGARGCRRARDRAAVREPGGCLRRTAGRRDYSLPPPARSYLEELQAHGVPIHSVGKVGQLFSGVGIDVQHPGATNAEHSEDRTLGSLEHGLMFTNLVETDQVYGHRHDVEGFHRALGDRRLQIGWLELTRPEDMLILTADHGCDVTSPRTDHTREHAPDRSLRGPRLTPPRRPARRRRRQRAGMADGRRCAELPEGSFVVPCECVYRSSRLPELPEVETIRRQRPIWRAGRSSKSRFSTGAGPGPTGPRT